jgi:hypothetical protein
MVLLWPGIFLARQAWHVNCKFCFVRRDGATFGRCYTVPRHHIVFHSAPPKNRKKQVCLPHVLLKRKVWPPHVFSLTQRAMLSFPTIWSKIPTPGTFPGLLCALLVHGRNNNINLLKNAFTHAVGKIKKKSYIQLHHRPFNATKHIACFATCRWKFGPK